MSRHAKLRHTEALTGILRHPTYEVIPIKGVEEAVADLPRQVRLTVTSSPVHGVDRTVQVAGRLSAMGFRVAPHLAARFVADQAHLAKIATLLGEYGIREIFVIGGDRDRPLGDFPDTAALLEALAADDTAFEEIGIAGYPEGHPTISEHALEEALAKKSYHATYITSQLCFDADAIHGWAHTMHRRGVMMPIKVGVPGVVPMSKLMRISTKIGVGESLRFMRSNRGFVTTLLGQGGTYRPGRLIEQLEPALAEPTNPIRGIHIYTFNEVARTEQWRQSRLAELAAA